MDLSQQEWAKRLEEEDNAVVLDVRTDDEWQDGHLPNALHIDIYKGQGFIDEVKKLDKDKTYFVYCKAGGRSRQACSIMQQLGFQNTYNLVGGFMKWEGAQEK